MAAVFKFEILAVLVALGLSGADASFGAEEVCFLLEPDDPDARFLRVCQLEEQFSRFCLTVSLLRPSSATADD